MSYRSNHASKWTETHSGGGLNYGTDPGSPQAINFNTFRTQLPLPTVPSTERIVSTCDKHVLVYSRISRAYFDRAPIRGLTYMGRCGDDDETAIVQWHKWLREQGVDV